MYHRLTAMLLGLALLLCACAQTPPPAAESEVPAPQENVEAESESNAPTAEEDTDEAELYDLFYVPAMDEEQQRYYDTYIQPLIYNGMLMISWSGEDYANISTAPDGLSESRNLIMAFEDIVGRDAMLELWETNGIDLPAEDVERVLLEWFPFRVEQLHEILYACYNEQTGTYSYEGGRGGGPIEGAVVGIEDEGEYVALSYALFTGYSGLDEEPASYMYCVPGVLTIQQTGNAYRYWSVEVGDEVEADAKRDVTLRD